MNFSNKVQRISIGLFFVFLSQMACGLFGSISTSPKDTPPYYGVFLLEGKEYIEIAQHEGVPHFSDKGFFSTENKKPTIIIWNPEVELDYLTLNLLDSSYSEIDYRMKPLGEDLFELQPLAPLEYNVYCLVQGDPMLSPASLPTWCFQIIDNSSSNDNSNEANENVIDDSSSSDNSNEASEDVTDDSASIDNSSEASEEFVEFVTQFPKDHIPDREVAYRLIEISPSGEHLYIWDKYTEIYEKKLFSLNLKNGNVKEIVTFEYENFYEFEQDAMIRASSDGKYLFIIPSLAVPNTMTAKIIELDTGKVITFKTPEYWGEDAEWTSVIKTIDWAPNTSNLHIQYSQGLADDLAENALVIFDPFTEKKINAIVDFFPRGYLRWDISGTRGVYLSSDSPSLLVIDN